MDNCPNFFQNDERIVVALRLPCTYIQPNEDPYLFFTLVNPIHHLQSKNGVFLPPDRYVFLEVGGNNLPLTIMYEIIETRPGTSSFTWFERVPTQIHDYYRRQIQLKNQYNPEFLDTCFVLLTNGRPVGRIATYLNPNLQYEGKTSGALGNYECTPDEGSAQVLLQAGYERLTQQHVDYIIGPFDGSTWDTYRFRTQDHVDSFYLEAPNPAYYNAQFKAFGFEPIGHYYSAIDRQLTHSPKAVEKVQERLHGKGIRFRSINLDDFEQELRRLYVLSVASFQQNFLFTPIKEETFIQKYLPYQAMINPEFVQFAEDETGELLGIIFAIEDFISTQDPRLIIKTLARKPGATYGGVGAVLVEKVYALARERKFNAVIHAYIKDEADSRYLSQKYTGEPFQHYVLYGMPVLEKRSISTPSYFLTEA